MKKNIQVIEATKTLLNDDSFKANHRSKPTFFTRDRKLPFLMVMLLVLQKSVKSMQLILNEFFLKLGTYVIIVTASAFTQSRQKLLYTAFIELNEKAIVEIYYKDEKYQKYKGFRLISIDGSKVILPNNEEIKKFFGNIKIANQLETTEGEYPVALASVLYDVMNNIAIDSILGHAKAYEVDLAIEHLTNYSKANDLLIFDRNYPSYRFLAFLVHENTHFLGRCSRNSFNQARMMFGNNDIESQVVTLRPHHSKKKQIEELGLPMEITVRFVRVVLDTGEVEVLVTSLLDENLYPTEDFKELYHLRWGIETYYGTIKGRLSLENFTGKSVETVLQDFYSTIFISNFESILTEDAQQELDKKNAKINTLNLSTNLFHSIPSRTI